MGIAAHRSRPRRKVKPGPGRGVIVSKERAQKLAKKAGGGKVKAGWRITLKVERDLAYDLDMRDGVAYVTQRYAHWVSEQVLGGQRPDYGTLPRVHPKTIANYGARPYPWLGVRTGYAAKHYWLGKVSGGFARASRMVKPYGGSGGQRPRLAATGDRSFIVKALLRRRPRPVELVSARGKSRAAIRRFWNEWLAMSFGDVRSPNALQKTSGELPRFKGLR